MGMVIKDMTAYMQPVKLNCSIEELASKQDGSNVGSFGVVSRDDAATVEISELAREMYGRNDAIHAAGKEYFDTFQSISENFADFKGKITYGNYSDNDVSSSDLNLGVVDKMQEEYDSYKQKITELYSKDDQERYMKKLDDAYNQTFKQNILTPLYAAYSDKLQFFEPDDEGTMKSIKAVAADKETLNEMVSGYLTNQSIKRKQHDILSKGIEGLNVLSEDASQWHDAQNVKQALTDSMDAYSSVKEMPADSDTYKSAKMAADDIAKKISDQYASQHPVDINDVGFKKNGHHTEFSRLAMNAFDKLSSNGFLMVDFSKIENLDKMIDEI